METSQDFRSGGNMLFSYLVLIFCSPGSWLNISKYRGVVRCTCDHQSSLPAFITVVCAQKLTLIFHNPTQEHIRVRRECFHCVCFLVGCWARKSPPYKQIIDICWTKPAKAFLPCWAGKGHPLSWPLFGIMGTKFTSRATFLRVLPGTAGATFS